MLNSISKVLDSLGMKVDLREGELISGALVIIETVDAGGGQTLQVLESEGLSWVRRLGMLHASIAASNGDLATHEMDDDD